MTTRIMKAFDLLPKRIRDKINYLDAMIDNKSLEKLLMLYGLGKLTEDQVIKELEFNELMLSLHGSPYKKGVDNSLKV